MDATIGTTIRQTRGPVTSKKPQDEKLTVEGENKSGEDVKVVEIKTSESKSEEVIESATADVAANDVASEEPKPKSRVRGDLAKSNQRPNLLNSLKRATEFR